MYKEREEEILKKCDVLFTTLINVHINIKPLADLFALYEETKKELDELKEIEKEHKKENGELKIKIQELEKKNCTFDKAFIYEKRIKDAIEEWDRGIMWSNADDRYFAIKILKKLLEE